MSIIWDVSLVTRAVGVHSTTKLLANCSNLVVVIIFHHKIVWIVSLSPLSILFLRGWHSSRLRQVFFSFISFWVKESNSLQEQRNNKAKSPDGQPIRPPWLGCNYCLSMYLVVTKQLLPSECGVVQLNFKLCILHLFFWVNYAFLIIYLRIKHPFAGIECIGIGNSNHLIISGHIGRIFTYRTLYSSKRAASHPKIVII